MAYNTPVFVFFQRQIVVVLSGNSARSFMPVYSKPLMLHKGVDNQLQFQVLDQNQKPVNITGKSITCRIINKDGSMVLLQKALTLQLPLTGIAVLNLNAADIEDIPAQQCYYTLEIPVNSFNYPVYVDQNAGGRGDLYIVNSILPSFVPSQEVSIPTGQPFPNVNPNSNANTTANIFYSSVINTEDNPILTIQAKYIEYTGNVTIEGSTLVDSDRYPIDDSSYANTSNTYGYTIRGFHPYVRMVFTANTGAVTNILAR